MKVKVRLDIKPSALAFEYSTAAKDFTPYCGEAYVDGLQRRFVEYEVINKGADNFGLHPYFLSLIVNFSCF